MNSCGNSNTSTKLRGSKCAEAQDKSVNQGREIEKEGSGVISSYSVNDLNVPRSTLVICQRNSNNYSSDHGFARFKPRYPFFLLCFGYLCDISGKLRIIIYDKIYATDSVEFQEMNFEWHVVAALQIVPGVGHVGGLLKRLSMTASQIQSPAITLHLDPSFKNR